MTGPKNGGAYSSTIRQIAYEVLYSINESLGHLIDSKIMSRDFTPVGFKLSFEVTIDSEEKWKLIMAAIYSKRPFIQRARISDDPSINKTITINSIMPTELQKVLDGLQEKNIQIRNVQKDDL